MQRTTAVSTSTARDILRRARRQQRLTQSQLADRAGVTKTVVARYESGQQPTVAALERLVAACGYELEWTLRNAGGASHATCGTVTEPATGPAFGAAQFPGPIGRRLSAHLGEILDLLEAAGATDPRLYGAVAEGCEGVASDVLIGVTPSGRSEPAVRDACLGPHRASHRRPGPRPGAPQSRRLRRRRPWHRAHEWDDPTHPSLRVTRVRAMGTPAR